MNSNDFKLPATDTFFKNQKDVLAWGAKEFSMLIGKLTSFRVCLDIGAHCGITTTRYAQHFKTVHSFEPIHYNLLVENTKKMSNVVAHNCAISDKEEIVEMYPNPINSGGGIIPDKFNASIINKRYKNEEARHRNVEPILVNCVSIDSFKYDEVDLIKIDVEGYILPVIRGMIHTLTNNSPVIQIEMSAFTDVNEQAHIILSNLGYFKFDKYNHDNFYYKK